MQPDRTGGAIPEDVCNRVAVIDIGDSWVVNLVSSAGVVMSHLPNDHEKELTGAMHVSSA
jgi:hypothetical protein